MGLYAQDAAERLNRWTAGQFLDPLFTGQWTPERQQMVPSFILPRFTPAQSAALKAAKVWVASRVMRIFEVV